MRIRIYKVDNLGRLFVMWYFISSFGIGLEYILIIYWCWVKWKKKDLLFGVFESFWFICEDEY